MYKILYLPTGEYLMIYNQTKFNVICRHSEVDFGLSGPRELIFDIEQDNQYKVAIFQSENIAGSWLNRLLMRSSCAKYHFIKEHFEIVKVE